MEWLYIGSAGVTLVGGLAAAWRWLPKFRRAMQRLAGTESVPSTTLKLVPYSYGQNWEAAGVDGIPHDYGAHVTLAVTNVSGVPIDIVSARLRIGRLRMEGPSPVLSDPHDDYEPEYLNTVPPDRKTYKAEFHFYGYDGLPRQLREGEDATATVIAVDAYGNEHKVRGIRLLFSKPGVGC